MGVVGVEVTVRSFISVEIAPRFATFLSVGVNFGMRLVKLVMISLFAAMACLAAIGDARAQSAGVEERVTRFLAIEGKQVPLPDGTWVVAGRSPPGAPTALVSVVLVRLDANRVDAAIVIQTNRLNSRVAWSRAALCEGVGLYFARTRYASEHDESCAYAAYVSTGLGAGPGIDPAWRQATRVAATRGWHLPDIWVDVAYRITDRRDALHLRYLFDPVGKTGPGAAMLAPAHVQSLGDWATAHWDRVDSGFRNRLPVDGTPGMTDWGRSAAAATPVAQTEPDSTASGQLGHLGVKMLTYRVFGTLTDLTVNYLWLGSLPSASGLAVVGGIASSSLYFVHELVWSRFEQPADRAGTVPGIGYEGPPPVPGAR